MSAKQTGPHRLLRAHDEMTYEAALAAARREGAEAFQRQAAEAFDRAARVAIDAAESAFTGPRRDSILRNIASQHTAAAAFVRALPLPGDAPAKGETT